MAHSVVIWRVLNTFTDTAPGSGGPYTFTAGSYVHSILDDATNTLTAKWSSTSADNTGFEITGGPSLYSDPTGTVELLTTSPFYQYCEGTTLHKVGTSNGWPYATLSNNLNNSECQIGSICDLEISTDYTVTPVSAPGSTDGAIQGSATSSNGLIKFSMDPNFPYGSSTPGGTMTPLSGWEIYTDSSDPVVWTPGAEPYVTVTPPTAGATKSDVYRMPYSTAWITGQTYTFNYNFRATSQNSDFRYIYMRAYDDLMNVLAEKIAYGWGTPLGVSGGTFQGTWALVAPAGMRYLGIMVSYSYTGGMTGTDETRVLQFEEVVSTDAPGVKTELSWSGLAAGTYTVYAKDSAGCQDQLSFVVGVTEVSNPRYRHEFQDTTVMSGYFHRVDIWERSYAGEPEQVDSGADPIIIKYVGDSDDPSKPLIPSNMELQLMCYENEQFESIFQSDDRKYLVKHWIATNEMFTSPELYWTGWVVPEFYSEPYIAPPFPVTITISDQIGELKNLDFLDEAGNKYRGSMSIIKILSEILKKTDLDLPIRCGVNVWAELMNQTDDPMLQAYLDMRIFEDKKCDYVLQEIAKTFRGQIFQSQGMWWFVRLSDAIGSFAYRDYDKDGNQIGSGTYSSIKELVYPSVSDDVDAVFSQRSQIMSMMRNYGKFAIINDLVKDGNIIDEGRFEKEDIEVQGSGNIGFDKWSVNIYQNGVTFGLEEVDNGDSKGALFIDFSQVPFNTPQSSTVIFSDVLPLEPFGGKIRFKFQYMVSPKYNVPYIQLTWALKLTSTSNENWWFGKSGAGAWTIFNTDTRNDIYVSSFNSLQSFDLLLDWPTIAVWKSIQIFFYVHDHNGRDYIDVDAMAAAIPSPPPGLKRMVREDPEPETHIWQSEYSYDAESATVVHPIDYDSGDADHRVLWRRLEIFGPLSSQTGLVNRFKFDNVAIALYIAEPDNAQIIDPPQTLSYRQTVDVSNQSEFSMDVLIGDMLRIDPENDPGNGNHYRNERYLYRSYIRLADGTPTQYWHRLGVTETKNILRITLEDYMAQFQTPQKKLSGSMVTSSVLHFINSIRDNIDMVRYRPMTFVFDAKKAEYTIDMSAVNAGPDGEPPVRFGAFDKLQFNEAFDTGN